jgi:dihydrodipicolinate synthase/N-acetylneuraminate lyase
VASSEPKHIASPLVIPPPQCLNYAAGVKAGCRRVGLSTGPVRAPLRDLSAADGARLADLLDPVLHAAAR